ncbi:NUDIX hydrolase [Nostocoides sp. HKS02]|uniref:NUDIX domain-containing protein n=1 Tax=Nostocoides sp. HKS02 TaxID=1813880 RepID=UPI0012B465E4|nr:NUDIX hydrolase [Tetrasphaera sp. HKS02]QGN57081.1 NUDIX domain-containing protein [Tetrasphaera sp. HKS02]
MSPEVAPEPLADRLEARPVVTTEVALRGLVWDVVRDRVDLGAAGEVTREYVRHPGAVAIAALDDQDRLCLVQQYRHPVRAFEWEIPAGLLDVDGEQPWLAAARELHEEADLVAATWHVLADYVSSPGGLDEALRVYLARDLAAVPDADRHERDGEELGMPVRWVPLEEARDAILAGRVHNSTLTIAALAALAARDLGWATLRPADAPWPSHPAYREARPA